mmetsp:Transcript_19937/g.51748  ORF Transcript_19937/g.51748 Transcript_19937/m.51748 type:complete len:787 (+) Transcript_19937:157-2517(+)|eukprot:CAMPEP_0182929232 /NCGR_PEP_ID=MMETSP0105_2-20130417/20263_1 /TAXON_ID=81532 ORGANISM="Acanthoeca-like sp., Strain 10tr" /NCGR_SAMPLE_ID=MMETSP0105_2 /ASSEMBLY_ACC=CAM_ASM_000205 /LENGTH=786 /DNA_ID=CAMNT_0025067355 /DNA_START=148 /DNA_END=2508 /DNA_ORIENTATION=-
MASGRKVREHLDDVTIFFNDALKVIFEGPHGSDGKLDRTMYVKIYTRVQGLLQDERVDGLPEDIVAAGAAGSHKERFFLGETMYGIIDTVLHERCNAWRLECEKYTGRNLLAFVSEHWKRYSFSARVCGNVFKYMNEHWLNKAAAKLKKKKHEKLYTTSDFALVIWRERVFKPLEKDLVAAALEMCTSDRNGDAINREVLQTFTGCLAMLGVTPYEVDAKGFRAQENDDPNVHLVVYHGCFEQAFLKLTREFYTHESTAFLADNSVTLYMSKVLTRLKEEDQRVRSYLEQSSRDKVIQLCEETLIEAHVLRLYEHFEQLVNTGQLLDMAQIYSLVSRVPDGVPRLQKLFEKCVEQLGFEAVEQLGDPKAIMKDSKNAKLFVDSIRRVYHAAKRMVTVAFDNDVGFRNAVDTACRSFVNTNALTKVAGTKVPPILLASYCHGVLEEGAKFSEGEEIEVLLDDTVAIFVYLSDADIFQKHYANLFAKRLIKESSASDDYEQALISKLKQVRGVEWTRNFQCMFSDISTSREVMKDFRDTEMRHSCLKNFTSKVLRLNAWPLAQLDEVAKIRVPTVLLKCVDQYTMFYKMKHHGRRLSWMYNLGTCDVGTLFTTRKSEKISYTITMSVMQLAALDIFESQRQCTVGEIAAITQMSDNTAQDCIDTFLKIKLLTQNKDGVLEVNKSFKSKRPKFSIAKMSRRLRKNQEDALDKDIVKERGYVMQAILVRVMKMADEKKMSMRNLIGKAIKQLAKRFKADVKALKKEVEMLIEKEYFRRDEKDKSLIHYVS